MWKRIVSWVLIVCGIVVLASAGPGEGRWWGIAISFVGFWMLWSVWHHEHAERRHQQETEQKAKEKLDVEKRSEEVRNAS